MIGSMKASRSSPKPRGCGTVTAAVVLLFALLIGGIAFANNQRSGWEEQSGTSPVQLSGTLQTETWLISEGVLDTDAQHEITRLRLTLTAGGNPYRDPELRVRFESGLTCQRHDGWRWSGGHATYYCEEYLPLSELDHVGIGLVEFTG